MKRQPPSSLSTSASRIIPLAPPALLLMVALGIAGCGSFTYTPAIPAASPTLAVKSANGVVHGGQQPVVGAAVYLFMPTTSGYGAPSV